MPSYEYDPSRTNYNTYGGSVDDELSKELAIASMVKAFSETGGGCPSCGGVRRAMNTVKFSELDDEFANAMMDDQFTVLDHEPEVGDAAQ